MSVNPIIHPIAPNLKVLHFGNNTADTPAGQVLRAFDEQLDAAEKKLRVESSFTRTKDYSTLKPEVAVNFLVQRLSDFTDKTYKLAYTDALTDLPNKQAHKKDRIKLFLDACEKQQPLSFIYLDLDNFKSYNDEFGHPEGDEALKEFARITEETLGKSGKTYRVGGEELVAILPGVGYKKMNSITEKIRENIEKQTIELKQEGRLKRPLTVSIGYATFKPNKETIQKFEEYRKVKTNGRDLFKDLEATEKSADAALYLAKGAGRNRVCGANHFELENL